MHVWIVMTSFLLLKTRYKFYQSSVKSCWREENQHKIYDCLTNASQGGGVVDGAECELDVWVQ